MARVAVSAWVHRCCALLVLVITSVARAQIGPPEPRALPEGYSLGVGLHNVQSRWMPYDYLIARNRFYLEGSHGLCDGFEIFSRVGGSEWVVNDIETLRPGMTRDVSSDGYPAFFSAGFRGRTWECDKWSVGVSVEAAVYAGMERTIRWTFDRYQELHFDPTVELNLGVSIGYCLEHGVVYGGPLLHFGYASADVRTHVFGDNWTVQDSIDAITIRDKAGVGGFVGWQAPVADTAWTIQLEGAALRDGFGGAISVFRSW